LSVHTTRHRMMLVRHPSAREIRAERVPYR
jgi:hypothetical protein